MFLSSVFCVSFPVFFIQRGDWFNTIQFLAYATFFFNFFTAYLIYDFIKSKKVWLIVVSIVIMLLMLPDNLKHIQLYYKEAKFVPEEKIIYFNILKDQPYGSVIEIPINPRPINLKDDTKLQDRSAISAFVEKPVYIGFENVMRNWGLNPEKRIDSFEDSENLKKIKLANIDADYFYLTYPDEKEERFEQRLFQYNTVLNLLKNDQNYEKFYQDEKVIMYRKKK
jgi:hypothetical protein